MTMIHGLKRSITEAGRAAAYSPAGLELARTLLATRPDSPVRRMIKAKGLEGRIRRIASENLPHGMYFAKLTIDKWEDWDGKQFRLFHDGKVVYGNMVEPPARGFPLEYRNIIVTSDDVSKFHLDIDAPFSLKIGRGAFTTPQQVKYDEQYGVEQHGDVFYSLRGNTTNPTRMLITFPGFGPSTTRISYAVSYLKDITDTDLRDTLMVCFQDRYLAAGSYMLVDNAGRSLQHRVWNAIEGLRSRFRIDQAGMLFFGASKGGSIAIQYAKDFPAASLLLAVPQMNLPYYFSKQSFRDNLFRNSALRDVEQPEDRLRQYFSEGRKIDYFYTNSDELSNHSLIELATDVRNLAKYRIDGRHSDVARAALPAMLGIIRRFLNGPAQEEFDCEQLRTFHKGSTVQVQVRVDPAASGVAGANWFVEGWSGRTRFLQMMTEHSYNFVKFTSAEQSLFPAYDPIDQLTRVVALEANGTMWTGSLPGRVTAGSRRAKDALTARKLSLHTETPVEYVVLDGDSIARFRYRCQSVASDGDTMEIHFVDDAETDVASVVVDDSRGQTSFRAVVHPLDGWSMADLIALRLLVAAGAERLLIVVHGELHQQKASEVLAEVDWPDTTVVLRTSEAEEVVGGRKQ